MNLNEDVAAIVSATETNQWIVAWRGFDNDTWAALGGEDDGTGRDLYHAVQIPVQDNTTAIRDFVEIGLMAEVLSLPHHFHR